MLDDYDLAFLREILEHLEERAGACARPRWDAIRGFVDGSAAHATKLPPWAVGRLAELLSAEHEADSWQPGYRPGRWQHVAALLSQLAGGREPLDLSLRDGLLTRARKALRRRLERRRRLALARRRKYATLTEEQKDRLAAEFLQLQRAGAIQPCPQEAPAAPIVALPAKREDTR